MSAAPQNTTYQALYRTCMKEAAAQGRGLMQRLVRRAAMAMPQRAATHPDERERKLLGEAARTLLKHEGALCEAYPQALLAEFAHAISGDTRKTGVLSFDSLELMGDDQMQESVDLLRLQQMVLVEVEAELAELNALVCAVQGLRSVQAERNPLRPEVYVRSLRTVVLQSPVPAGMRNRWIQFLGEALPQELARAYQELCVILRSHGVVGAGFTATPTPEKDEAIQEWRADRAVGQRGGLLNVKELRGLLTGELDGAPAAPPVEPSATSPEFPMTMPAALEALQEMKQADQVMKRLQQRDVSAHGPRGLAQALGQEVVALMVENIAADARLLPPVQQLVRELQPALERLALGDPRFFSDRRHPARRMLEQMTQRSLAWESVGAPGFAAFIEPLQQAVEVLLSTHIEGAEPFDFAVTSLEEAWGDLQQRDRHYREKAVRTLLQAEQRNLLAEKIAKEMRGRADVAGAPREIGAFITGPWSQVLAQARLGDDTGSPDPGGFASAVADLVWSAQPRVASANTARLARLAPQLMEKLRHGLATIDYPAPAAQRFLAHLAGAHDQAMNAAAQPGRPVSLSTTMTREELEAMLGDEDSTPGPWLGPTEAQQSGFLPTHQSIAPRPLFQETQPAAWDTRPGALTPVVTEAGLPPGAWVEMMIDGGWARYQVTWASPHATLFMFANAAGKTHSMTRRLLDKMLQNGTLRVISREAVVDGALDAVAQAALRNSLDIRL
ncbi:DUF1631 family protein [Ramlibacter sp. WS9]|uniref:DUF1631 family protein n=1 Tax=Ramlibacter sp. WS9 TaxID=1882741 RepID=UPI0011448D19|nr:DUF1631 family protein [Ramlibacter sp. WS9]ROZ69671.1 DUF1631 family protein [Ramlibacter sp. WS9]